MYPNFRFLAYDWFGVDIPALALVQSFGFFLALSFLASAWWVHLDLKRRESLGWLQGRVEKVEVGQPHSPISLILNGIIGFLIGFKGMYAITDATAFSGDNARANLLSMNGHWLGGIALGVGLVLWKYFEKQQELKQYPTPTTLEKTVMPHQRVGDFIIMSAVSGIIGAKVLYLVEAQPEDWVAALFSGSGLTVYGGLIFAFFVVGWYAKSKGVVLSQLIDTAAPAMILSYGIGRLGCHHSGDGDWGDPNPAPKPFSWLPDWLWAYSYPNNVIGEGVPIPDCGGYPFGAEYGYCNQLVPPAYPTPVWEFLMTLVIFLILVVIRKRITQGGLLFCIYLIFNGVERFSIEMIRVNEDYRIFGLALTQAQFIALVLIAIGIVGCTILGIKQRQANKNLTE